MENTSVGGLESTLDVILHFLFFCALNTVHCVYEVL